MKLISIDQNNIPEDFDILDIPNGILAISKDKDGNVKFWKEQI